MKVFGAEVEYIKKNFHPEYIHALWRGFLVLFPCPLLLLKSVFVGFWRQAVTLEAKLTWKSLCSLFWPQIHGYFSASATLSAGVTGVSQHAHCHFNTS